jgi:hypothetical protein
VTSFAGLADTPTKSAYLFFRSLQESRPIEPN